MTTSSLVLPAQLYVAAFWEGLAVHRGRDRLMVEGPPPLRDLYREELAVHRDGVLTLLVAADAIREDRQPAVREARALYRTAAMNSRTEHCAFAHAVDRLRILTQPETPADGPCEHCGKPKGHGSMQLRDYGVLPHVRLHPKCQPCFAIVREAIATAALADLQDTIPLPALDPQCLALRSRVLASLGLTLADHGLARRLVIQRYNMRKPTNPRRELTCAEVDWPALPIALRAKRTGITVKEAVRLAGIAFADAGGLGPERTQVPPAAAPDAIRLTPAPDGAAKPDTPSPGIVLMPLPSLPRSLRPKLPDR
jgi:hypothetical protein